MVVARVRVTLVALLLLALACIACVLCVRFRGHALETECRANLGRFSFALREYATQEKGGYSPEMPGTRFWQAVQMRLWVPSQREWFGQDSLSCPVNRKTTGRIRVDYRGPDVRGDLPFGVPTFGVSTGIARRIIAADRLDNHDRLPTRSVNVLFLGGWVEKAEVGSHLWSESLRETSE